MSSKGLFFSCQYAETSKCEIAHLSCSNTEVSIVALTFLITNELTGRFIMLMIFLELATADLPELRPPLSTLVKYLSDALQ